MVNHQELNIVILPDSDVSQTAINKSYLIDRKFHSQYTLDGVQNKPHITLYQTAFPHENLEIISQTLAEIASKTKPFTVELGNLSNWMEFLFWDAEKTPELLALHAVTLFALNPLREGCLIPEDKGRLNNPDVPQSAKDNILRYGYPVALENYPPHISITRLRNTREAEMAVKDRFSGNSKFTVDSIHLANRGLHGTCNRIFNSFPFSS